jgi:hypothetical protein
VQQGEKVALEVRDGQRGRQAVNMKDQRLEQPSFPESPCGAGNELKLR